MNIKIVCVGKIKESFYREAIEEYSKRLSRYCNLRIVEVQDERTKENASEAEVDLVLSKEKDRILKSIEETDYVIALAIKGNHQDSVTFANGINQLGINSISNVCFVIGGSLGLHNEILGRSNEQLSFSDMTFPHQLMRVILLEQIYRGFKISNNEPYHK